MTQLDGKISTTTPEGNEIDRLDRAAHPAGTNGIHKKSNSMKPKARHSARYGYAAPQFLPPNLSTVGPLLFTDHDFATLDAWLAEDGWPDEHMDIAMLEGYLVALLVWPIELAPGAWLPRIWGIRGWKVAAKIATPENYSRFIALVMGLFQELEHRLVTSPPARTFVLGRDAPYISGRYFAGAAWATGFMMALQENSTGLGSRSPAVRSAVENIAHYASARSTAPGALTSVAAALSAAVTIIMSERPVRGPVAALPLKKVASLRAAEKQTAKRALETPEMEVFAEIGVSHHAGEQMSFEAVGLCGALGVLNGVIGRRAISS
jgi:yecA family protein